MPSARTDHASAAIDDKLYVTGGYSSSETDTIFEYDPTTDTWSTLYSSMDKSRASHVTVSFGNGLVILGGAGLSSVEFVYPGGTSGTGENMPRQMNYMAGAVSGNGDSQRIYLMGGVKYDAWASSCNEAKYLSYCYRLDPLTWTWTNSIDLKKRCRPTGC